MAVFLDEDGLVSPLEQMTRPAMQVVEKLRIHAVQLPHPDREVAVRRFNKEMIVVVHQTVCVADPIVALVDVLERVQEIDTVLVAFVDGLLFITPGGDVVDSAGILYAQRAGHGGRISKERWQVKHYRPDPKMFFSLNWS